MYWPAPDINEALRVRTLQNLVQSAGEIRLHSIYSLLAMRRAVSSRRLTEALASGRGLAGGWCGRGSVEESTMETALGALPGKEGGGGHAASGALKSLLLVICPWGESLGFHLVPQFPLQS